MTLFKVGLESSSIMPLVAITPLTQDCYETILNYFSDHMLLAHEDSIAELKGIFHFRANTFYSNPIIRLEKIRGLPRFAGISLKGIAIKLLLDGQAGGWIGNKNSRVQALFFSDVIDSISDTIDNPEDFCNEVTMKMRNKIETFNNLLTPIEHILSIESRNILPYWGYHNISAQLLSESKSIRIRILPNCESFEMFEHLPSATRRDTYHYHMLKKERVKIILVGDANYKKNICHCQSCMNYDCETVILKGDKRKAFLNLI
jgi:hypothetical protein